MIFRLGLMMAVANVIGSIVGVRVALKYGSGFVPNYLLIFGFDLDLSHWLSKCL